FIIYNIGSGSQEIKKGTHFFFFLFLFLLVTCFYFSIFLFVTYQKAHNMYENYVIWYCNPRITNNEMRILNRNKKRVIIKARNNKEAEVKAFKHLATMGMLFTVEKIKQ
ncbi:MAG: hypothetical protein ACUZ8H_15770, partial [Candidatus Anammoxibacter sp.]